MGVYKAKAFGFRVMPLPFTMETLNAFQNMVNLSSRLWERQRYGINSSRVPEDRMNRDQQESHADTLAAAALEVDKALAESLYICPELANYLVLNRQVQEALNNLYISEEARQEFLR
jgi:hypothetical protein